MTIVFKELAGSPVETYDPDGMKAQRRLLCAYEDRYAVAGGADGRPASSACRRRGAIPTSPTSWRCALRIEPFEKKPDDQGTFHDLTADLNSYSGQFVEVVVDYELLGGGGASCPGAAENTLLTYRMDFGGEYVELPAMRSGGSRTAPLPVDAPTPCRRCGFRSSSTI